MLRIHRSQRADRLVCALADVLAHAAGDPFEAQVVAVPSKGVERWLAQQLSTTLGAVDGDGVCANVHFPSSSRLLDEAIAKAVPEYAAAGDAWAAEAAVWPLVSVIDACAPGESWCKVLATHLGLHPGGTDKGRRLSVAGKLARLFVAYGNARPSMIQAWVTGSDEDGAGNPLPEDLLWQAELWRRLRTQIGVPSPAELLDAACATLAEQGAPDLPREFSVFGPTRLSPSRIRILTALAERHDVHLWLHHPSPALWHTIKHSAAGPGRRRSTPTFAQHPLLASLSRDVRELQLLLQAAAPDAADTQYDIGEAPDTLLGRLQRQLADDVAPNERIPLPAADRSVTIHACHGPARQVEVIREAVLGLLADDPTLEPRDVLIMCPDIEAYAPLVAASFGMADVPDAHPAAKLRVQLADRSLRQINPLLRLLSQVLDVAANRVTAPQVLDLVQAPAVRRRFGFDDDAVERLGEWTVAAGARWGLDTDHRQPYQLGSLDLGTWHFATDRLLLGVAMEEDRAVVGTALPLDDVDSSDVELAGRFAEFLDRLGDVVRFCQASHPVTEWMRTLEDAVRALGEPLEAWQELQLHTELDEVVQNAQRHDVPLGLADITALLQRRLAGRPTRASFRTGTLTVCTLVPMRSVPHRVVCILGMDDGAFPRQSVSDGDDVLARDPRTGERDVRSEDRQLFLDAVCAAQEHLVIAYTGADPRQGAVVPPCVPLAELLNAIDATALAPSGGPASGHVVVRHPLQPFDPRNFTPGRLGQPHPFSFDPAGLAGARASLRKRRPAPPLVSRPLGPPPATESIALDDLADFLQHPVRGFLRQRLGVSRSRSDEEPDDALPIEVKGLKKWQIGTRALERCLDGVEEPLVARLEYLRGELPPGHLGNRAMQDIGAEITALLHESEPEREAPPRSEDVSVRMPDGRELTGTVSGIRADVLLDLRFSKMSPKYRLGLWVRYLSLVASGHAVTRALLVARAQGPKAERATVAGVDQATAVRVLTELVQLRDEGLCAPLPIMEKTSERYASARRRGRPIGQALGFARREWAGNAYCESKDDDIVLVFGPDHPFESLTAEAACGAEAGWFTDEPSRFGALARRLWTPVLDFETDGQP